MLKKASIEQGIHNRHQKTTKTVRVAGIIAAILLLSCVLALLPQSAQASTLTDTINVGNGVGGIAVTPNGEYVYSTNRFDGTVSVISTLSNTVTATVTVGQEPLGVAVTPNGEYVYVTNYYNNTVSVIATATNTVTATLTDFNYPSGVAIAPNGELVYITNYNGNSISVISTATNTVTATITGLNYPEDVAVAPDGESIYVKTNYDGVSVLVISTATNTVTATINLAGFDSYFENGVGGIAVAPNGEYVYVTSNDWTNGNSVSVISTDTNTVTTTITLGGWSDPHGGSGCVAVAPNGEYVYATNNDWMSGYYWLSVISTRTNTIMENVTLGEIYDPFGGGCVAVTPNGEYVYVANGRYSSSISVISVTSPSTYTITVTQSDNGQISPGTTTVDYGDTPTFTITPNSGYHIASISVNGEPVTVNNPSGQEYQFSEVSASGSISATFAIDTFAISVSQGDHGTISPGTTTINYGSSQEFTFTPTTGYHIVAVIVNGTTVATTSPYTVSDVTGSTSLTATFAIDVFSVTVGDHTHGSISSTNGTSVNYGNDLSFSVAPDTGYHLVSVLIDGETASAPYNFVSVSAAHTISATFAIDVFSVTVGDHTHGSISSTNGTSVNYGNDLSFSVTPDTGYHLVSVLIDGETASVPYNFVSVTAVHTISATFAIDTYVITVSQGAHGVIAPSTTNINYGGSQEFTFAPATGYHLTDVLMNGTSVMEDVENGAYTVSDVTGATTLTATYAIDTFAITVSQGDHGTIAPTTTTVNYGGSQAFTFTPDMGYHLVNVLVNGTSVWGSVADGAYTVSTVTGATSLTAEFAINTYAITVSQSDHGTISPGTTSVNYGSSQEFTITPRMGYHISSLVVDGSAVTVASTFTFSNVQDDHSITASFTTNTLTATVTTTFETYPIEISGNITTEQFSNMTITPYQDTKTTIVEFTLTGPNGTEGFCNLTLPKIAIPFGTNPVVYIDGTVAENQSFTEGSDNFYIAFTTHFSTHQIEILFTTESNPYIPKPITNWAPSQTSNTSPNPTTIPTPTIPPTPTATPRPTANPTSTPTTMLATIGQYIAVAVAMILLGVVIIGLVQRRKHSTKASLK